MPTLVIDHGQFQHINNVNASQLSDGSTRTICATPVDQNACALLCWHFLPRDRDEELAGSGFHFVKPAPPLEASPLTTALDIVLLLSGLRLFRSPVLISDDSTFSPRCIR